MDTTKALTEKLTDDIVVIVQKYCEAKSSGNLKTTGDAFSLLMSLIDELSNLVETAQTAMELDGEGKKAFVCECVTLSYLEIDPNLPFIPEPLETIIEKWTFKHVVPAVIDWLVDRKNTQGEFKHTVKDIPKGDVG